MGTGRTLLAVSSAVVLAACGGEGRRLAAGEVTVLVAAPPDAGMDALGGGRIEVVGGCLGADGVVIIWPNGTRVVQEDPLEIEVPEVGRLGLGDRVELAGGMISEPGAGQTPPADDDGLVPRECDSYPVFLAH